MGLRAATHLLWASVLPNSPLRRPPPAFRQACAKDKPDREEESLRPQDELDHAQGSGSLKKRRLLNCGSGQLPREAVVSLLLVPWHLELPQGRWAQVRVETGCLVEWGPGIWEGLVPPWYEGRACWIHSVPTEVVHVGIHACVCVGAGAHVCALEGGELSSELTPGLPWRYLSLQPGSQVCPAHCSSLGSPMLPPPSSSAGSDWPPSEDAIKRICTLFGEVGGQMT